MPKPNPLDTLAFDLFEDRRNAELNNGGNHPQAFDLKRNPDARALYLLGMRDIIISMDNWTLHKVPPQATANMLQAIFRATDAIEKQQGGAH